MSTPRQPSRLRSYSAGSKYYPRELTEADGVLKLINDDGSVRDLNSYNVTTIIDSQGTEIGVINPKSGGTITIPDATPSIRGLLKLGGSTPVAPGTATQGTSNIAARADHRHPLQTTISGNAGTATKLQEPRTIGLSGVTATATSFDGSKDITIPITAIPATIITGLSKIATSGSYNDLTNKPAMPTASSSVPLVSGTASAGSSTEYARADHVHPVQTSISGNAGTATKLTTGRNISISGAVTGTATSFDGSKDINIPVTSIDGSKITGVIPLASIPKGAQERLIPVVDDSVRLALTSDNAQNGDVIKVENTGLMYYIVDDTKLGSSNPEDAFSIFTAGAASSVDWAGISNKPSFALIATSGSYNDLTDKPTMPTASSILPLAAGTATTGDDIEYARADHVHPAQTSITGNAGTATKLSTARNIGITGVTATAASFDGSKAVNIEITAIPATLITNLKTIATSGSYNDLSDKPTIPTASSTMPKVAATTAVIGTSTTYARADHVHPVQTSISGNAGTATKLANSRSINGIGFDGSKDITIKADPLQTKLTSENLDSILSEGEYWADSSNTCTNKPSGVNAFGLKVYHTGSYAQIITADNGSIYTRTASSSDGTTWNTWTPIYTGTNPSPHSTIQTTVDTTSSSSPYAGGSFTAIDNVTRDPNGHVTKINTKTVTIPSNAKNGFAYATCSTESSITIKEAILVSGSFAIGANGYISVKFTNAVLSGSSLKVGNTSEKAILNNGDAIKSGIINAGDTATFIYDGSYYQLVSVSNPSKTYIANIGTEWEGDAAPYTQTISISGITVNDNPIVDTILSSEYETAKSELSNYGKIYRITTADNSITVYANEKTDIGFSIQLKCVK